MESSFVGAASVPLLPRRRSFADKPHQKQRPLILRHKASSTRICAAGNGNNDRDYGGRLVDQNMVELRKRIRDVMLREDDEYDRSPADWMKWEKQYHKHYRSDVFQLIGLLQIALMNTRPSTALALLTLLAFSLPTSMGMIMMNLFGAAKGIFPGS
ncbi:hypothetical protein H6P81_008946 [Aristolochia fimbriata]|uniref:Uncharacterized protein n=1 Tax=Aristolochia fimbriata TaxID=158543 RepID=A0AAV7EMP5_ARIFI|nr:hypothetical protein H6P81_008946 [Aristolochia fimbriata]